MARPGGSAPRTALAAAAVIALVLVATAPLVTAAAAHALRTRTVRVRVCRPPGAPDPAGAPEPCVPGGSIRLPLTYTPQGVHVVDVEVDRGDGRFRTARCVVDTGSRFLSVAAHPGDTRGSWRPEPAPIDEIRYGTQHDHVHWFRLPVRMAGHRVCNHVDDLAVAVAHQRTCGDAGCFDVLGLAAAHAPDDMQGRAAGAPLSLLAQVARATGRPPSFCVAMGRAGHGYVAVDVDCARGGGPEVALRPGGVHYVVDLEGIRVGDRDVGEGVLAPSRLMVDTGSNMLGVPPAFAEDLAAALRGHGGDLRLRLRGVDGQPFDYVVPPDTYARGDELLVDPNPALQDTVVIGSMFLRGKRLSFDGARRTVRISEFA